MAEATATAANDFVENGGLFENDGNALVNIEVLEGHREQVLFLEMSQRFDRLCRPDGGTNVCGIDIDALQVFSNLHGSAIVAEVR